MPSDPVTVEQRHDDPAYALPLPPTWALDWSSRNYGFENWFAVPALVRDPINRRVIVGARKIVAAYGEDELVAECRERASYLKAMEPEGLSTISRQAMETLNKAADQLARFDAERTADLEREIAALREVLAWYEDRARNCKKLTQEGDNARADLVRDGGRLASKVLEKARV